MDAVKDAWIGSIRLQLVHLEQPGRTEVLDNGVVKGNISSGGSLPATQGTGGTNMRRKK